MTVVTPWDSGKQEVHLSGIHVNRWKEITRSFHAHTHTNAHTHAHTLLSYIEIQWANCEKGLLL